MSKSPQCYYAFKTRHLPDNFNESKYIALCVYTTFVIWFVSAPSYLTTTRAYYQSVVLAAALLLNSTVALICLYVPKIYAVCRNLRITKKGEVKINDNFKIYDKKKHQERNWRGSDSLIELKIDSAKSLNNLNINKNNEFIKNNKNIFLSSSHSASQLCNSKSNINQNKKIKKFINNTNRDKIKIKNENIYKKKNNKLNSNNQIDTINTSGKISPDAPEEERSDLEALPLNHLHKFITKRRYLCAQKCSSCFHRNKGGYCYDNKNIFTNDFNYFNNNSEFLKKNKLNTIKNIKRKIIFEEYINHTQFSKN